MRGERAPGVVVAAQLSTWIVRPGSICISDVELGNRISQLNAVDKGVVAVLIAHLAEFEARDLHLEKGHNSMFAFCVHELKMAEQEAYKRIAVARLARRLPGILDRLACGRIHLSALTILAPHLAEDNWERILDQAESKSMRELERIAVSFAPKPDRGDAIRRLAAPNAAPEPEAQDITPQSNGSMPEAIELLPPAPRQRIEPLSPERVHFGFTGSERLREKVQRVRELMWHSDPAGRLEFVFEKLADFYLDRKDPDRRLARRANRLSSGRRRPGGRR